MKDFEMKDTAQAQIESLCNFMDQLGYKPARANGGWVTDQPQLKGIRNLSNATAIKLHNLPRGSWKRVEGGWMHAEGVNVELYLSPVRLNMLFASKLFHKIKFQATRDSRGFQIQSHMVKPVDSLYTDLLDLAA